jgi:UDP-glucose:(heptosyl)LPS alpha-1,3-glucosyltransferase
VLNIALVILHADPARGGAERYTIDLADRAGAARTCDLDSLLQLREPIENVRFVKLTQRGATRTGKYLRFLDSLDAHLKDNRYDIVHAMLPVRTCDVYHPHAGIAAEAMEKWTTTFNSPPPGDGEGGAKLLTGPKPPVVLALSEYIKDSSASTTRCRRIGWRHCSMRWTRPISIPRGRDIAPALSPMSDEGTPYAYTMLMVAQDFVRKGLLQAIQAMAMLESWYKPLRLVVVGDDRSEPYERKARDLDLDVKFVGGVNDTRPYYRSADFLVLPTRHDPCSLVVLEGLAMGLAGHLDKVQRRVRDHGTGSRLRAR